MSSSTVVVVPPSDIRRQKWDRRFLELSNLVSTWSKDPSTQVGAVIADDARIVSVGYNGFAGAMPDVNEHYENKDEKYSRIVHAETNALLFARVDVRTFTLYSNFPPCDRCAVNIIQAGIARVVCPVVMGEAALRWRSEADRARKYFEQSGVTFVEIGGANESGSE